jgi:hypothetical protein
MSGLRCRPTACGVAPGCPHPRAACGTSSVVGRAQAIAPRPLGRPAIPAAPSDPAGWRRWPPRRPLRQMVQISRPLGSWSTPASRSPTNNRRLPRITPFAHSPGCRTSSTSRGSVTCVRPAQVVDLGDRIRSGWPPSRLPGLHATGEVAVDMVVADPEELREGLVSLVTVLLGNNEDDGGSERDDPADEAGERVVQFYVDRAGTWAEANDHRSRVTTIHAPRPCPAIHVGCGEGLEIVSAGPSKGDDLGGAAVAWSAEVGRPHALAGTPVPRWPILTQQA